MKDQKYQAAIIDLSTNQRLELGVDGVAVFNPTLHRIGLVNMFTGVPIPEDEPTFIVRAKDEIAPEVPAHYRARAEIYGCSETIFDSVDRCLSDMIAWREKNISFVKKPD